MIDRIIGWSIRNRVVVLLATLAMVCWGSYAAWIAPVDAIPDLSENQVIVHAEWPGHGPSEIEDQVTAPLGLELNGVRGVKTIRSSSDFGVSTLWVIFDESVDVATGEARARRPPGHFRRQGAAAFRCDAEAGAGWAGDRADLLVHGRRGRTRPGATACYSGLVCQAAACGSFGRCGGRQRGRDDLGIPDRGRPGPASKRTRRAHGPGCGGGLGQRRRAAVACCSGQMRST